MMTKNKKIRSKRPIAKNDPRDREGSAAGTRALRVEINRIRFYERNPRRSKNPEFDRIKASILISGMDQALLITQRPGETDYIVQAGGNTRLQILKELFETTGEERFLLVDCLFVDWDCESAVLLAHLRENELRGNLTFIDKARAVFDAKSLITEELAVNDLSVRNLQTFLSDHGYSLSHGMISLMDYAVSVLLPLLPTALEWSLGKPQVQRIRNLQRVGEQIWNLRGAGTEAEFDAAFQSLCQRHDGVDWQLEPLRQAIENEIAEAAECSIQVIRMEFDCRLAGREPDIPEFAHEETLQQEAFPVSARNEAATESAAERQARTITGNRSGAEGPSSGTTTDEPLCANESADVHSSQLAVELPPEADSEALFRRIGIQSKSRIPLALLRATAYTLAQRLGERHGIGTLIMPLNDNGLGYLVCDTPPPSLAEQLDDELLAQVSTMWWQLMAFAEMPAAPAELLHALLDEESRLSPAMLTDAGAALAETVFTVDPAHFAQQFWRQLNHEDWCDWLCLAHNYRELHRMAGQLNTPLWSSAT